MKKMQRILAAALSVAALAGLVSCSSGSGSGTTPDTQSPETTLPVQTEAVSSEPVYGGSATVYFKTIASDIDPAAPDSESYMLWYERLFVLDWEKEETTNDFKDLPAAEDMTGQIADTWSWDSAAQTFTVTIRDDIKFQKLADEYDYYGGRSLTANDVKYSYDRALGIGSGFTEPVASMNDWRSIYYMVDSIEVVDDLTVVFHFNTSSDVAVNDFMEGMLSIAGPEYDALTPEQKTDWHYACGTGPYILTEYVVDSYMTFTKNPDYYDYDERYPENKLPYLDTITLVKIMDTATLLSSFMAGDVDIIGNNQSVFSASELAQLSASMDPSKYVTYDLDITSRVICLKQTCEPLTDIRVRQAMQYAINLEEITSAYFNFDELVLNGVFGNYSKFCNTENWSDELKESYLTYDPEKAKELLAEAGYPDGFTFTLAYATDGDNDIYTLVKEYLAQVGITMELQPISVFPEYLQTAQSRDNEICSSANLSLTNTNIAFGSFASDGAFNALALSVSEIDSLIATAKAAQTAEEQMDAMHAFDTYVMEQHYVLAISPVEKSTYVVSSDIGGYNGESLYAGWNGSTILARLWNVTGA